MRRLGAEPPGSASAGPSTYFDAFGNPIGAVPAPQAITTPQSLAAQQSAAAASSGGGTNIFGLNVSTPVLWMGIGVLALIAVATAYLWKERKMKHAFTQVECGSWF